MSEYYHAYFKSPVGIIKVETDDAHLVAATFIDETPTDEDRPNELCTEAVFQLKAFFHGKLQRFDLPIRECGTAFQWRVWQELLKIPFGKTITYGQLAENLGDQKLVRAVGTANGRNPFAVMVPCHRVIGADGKLVGYAGGLDRKRRLLEFEAQLGGGQLVIF